MVNYSPDIILIYLGHNEFISFANPATRLNSAGNILTSTRKIDLRTIQFLSKMRLNIAPPSTDIIGEYLRLYKPEDKEEFYERFRLNLSKMIGIARKHKIQVVLGTVSYNYAVPPFFNDGSYSMNYVRAFSARDLQRELRFRPNNAFLEYAIGERAFENREYSKAKRWFDMALLDDSRPARATTKINEIIRDFAYEEDVPLADINGAVASQSPHGIPDFTFFVDHCHLNDNGNSILQRTFADVIIKSFWREGGDGNFSISNNKSGLLNSRERKVEHMSTSNDIKPELFKSD